MQQVIDFCIKNRALVIFAVLFMGVVGVRAAKQLPVDAVPDVTNTQVQILTNAPSLGPVEIERYITSPVETVMSGLPSVEEVRSLSRFGLSAVTVVFEEGTDIYAARQLINERLSEAREAIPNGYGSPSLGPISTGLGEIYQFEVKAETMCPPGGLDTESCYTPMELRSILDWYVAYQLRPIEGVVEVNAFGGDLKTYEVQIDPDRLSALRLSIGDVFGALERNNSNAGGGYLTRAGEQRLVRGEGLVTSLEDVRDIRVATRRDGTPIFIRDLGTVRFAPMIRQGAVTRDGEGEAVTGTVMMLMGANSGQVSAAVKERLQELSAGLPPGVSIETYYDRAELVDRTIRTVVINLVEGGVLVIVVLLLLLGNLRGGLLVASIIPLAMLGTLIAMSVQKISGNLMSLGALDFGLIIDGAIVIVENIIKRLSETRARGAEARVVIRDAVKEVLRPVLFGTAMIMIVYVPVLSLQGIEGKMFTPMAMTVLAALAVALLLAITMVPAVSVYVFKNGVAEEEPWLARTISRVYDPILGAVMRQKGLALLGAVGLIGLGGALASQMGAEFIPKLDEGTLAIQAVRPPSVALEESVAATTRLERAIKDAFPHEIKHVISRTGRPEIATDPMGVELSDIYLTLHPIEEWTRVDSKPELIEAIKETLEHEVPGQNYSFSQPIELRTNELISGARSDVAINLYGPDLKQLDKIGEEIAQTLKSIPEATDVNADQVAGLPTLRVAIDRRAAARYGINAEEILNAVSIMGGHSVGTVFEGQERYSLQVRLASDARKDRYALERLLISAPGGQQVPLGQVAKIVEEEGPAVISRENAQRRRTIQTNVRGGDLAGFVQKAQEKVASEVRFPPGYFVTWGGQFKNLKAATERLSIAVPAALLFIFLLLFTTFGAARPALIIYLNVPVAAVGGVAALWVRGMPFSISAAIGFIALSGIAVLNGVVLVSYIRELQLQGSSLHEASVQGARRRLRPVLMTAFTDGIGFLPMAISVGAGAEVQRPLATVVIGGLVTSTLLTLLVLPAVYSWLGDVPEDPAANPL